MAKKKLKKIPEFKNEDEEREFWPTHDSTDYVDWSQANRVRLPRLKISTRSDDRRNSEGGRNQAR